MKKIISLFCAIVFLSQSLQAQDVQMADSLRSDGKIYALVAIILIILLGLIAFVFYTERKVLKLEKQLKK